MVRSPQSQGITQGRWRKATLFYIFLIYITLPFMPGFWRGVESVWGDVAALLPMLILAAGWCVSCILLRRSYRVFPYLILAGLVQFFLISQVALTFEKFHIVQYGILGFFVVRSLDGRALAFKRLGTSVLVAFLVGLIDECIQGLIPNRFFGWEDVLFNTLASTTSVLCLIIGRRRKGADI